MGGSCSCSVDSNSSWKSIQLSSLFFCPQICFVSEPATDYYSGSGQWCWWKHGSASRHCLQQLPSLDSPSPWFSTLFFWLWPYLPYCYTNCFSTPLYPGSSSFHSTHRYCYFFFLNLSKYYKTWQVKNMLVKWTHEVFRSCEIRHDFFDFLVNLWKKWNHLF